jgi:hypothetical protein
MNKLITILILLLSFSCANDKQQYNTSNYIAKLETPKAIVASEVLNITDEFYNLQISIETSENNTFNLVIAMELHKGSSFISPFETKEFSGKFYMDFGSYKDLSFDVNIVETPRAIAIIDKFKNEPVIWVKENTTYTQPLKIHSEDDFEVFGKVQFTIEPRCTFEEIPFVISFKDGVMKLFSPKC